MLRTKPRLSLKPVTEALSHALKQVAGNCSSPATEDTGINQKNVKANKQAQGMINKIFVFQGTYK